MRPFTGQSGDHVVVLNWKDNQHPATGGAETYCHKVSEHLVTQGCRVTMVVSRPPCAARQAVINGVSIRRMGGTFSVYPLTLLWLLMHRRSIQAVIDSQNGLPFFSPLVLRRSTPVTLLIHHVHQEQFGLYFPPIAAAVGRWLERTGSQWVYGRRPVSAVSPSTRTEVRRALRLGGPIYVAPNGHEPVVHRAAPRAPTPTIVCVGRLATHKRWDLLLHAVARIRTSVPDLHLHLVGTGPAAPSLKALVTGLDLQDVVTMHGYVSAEDRDALLSSAWLTASTSRGEGWGLSIVEAASFGVPAVAFDVSGLRDSVLHEHTGWLTNEQTLDQTLTDALDLLSSSSTATRIGSECRAWSTQLTWSATGDRLRAILAQEAQRPGSRIQSRSARADLVAMVTLNAATAQRFDTSQLRFTDQTNFCPLCVTSEVVEPFRILLPGADENDALRLVQRIGGGAISDGLTVTLARPMDLLTWNGFGTPHNYRPPGSVHYCPRQAAEATFLGTAVPLTR